MYRRRSCSFKLRRAVLRANRLRYTLPPQPPIQSSFDGSASRNTLQGEAEAMDPLLSEEAFKLVSGGNPAFSMIIRLAPGMVEEIKRLEARGGRSRVKFDPNPCNQEGNIIDIGGKEFRFTWSQEFGDLCDIYEERQSGEDGNGLLVESGCAWRKLNVQRTLDESTKNLVKKRSEEAERKHKSRKAIVLEPGNPSMKALAAAEAAPQKNYNKKKEAAPPKKSKVEILQVGGPPKSTSKPGSSSTTHTRSTAKCSPLSSALGQTAASSSKLGAVNRSQGIVDAVPSREIVKQDTNNGSEKEILTIINNATYNIQESKGKNIAEPIDLESILISLLMNKPDGVTVKALEKAVKGIIPNPKKKIKPILRKIASYKSPGRYILLPRVDLESSKKSLTESGSSPDDNHLLQSTHQESHDEIPAPQGGSGENVPSNALEELGQLKAKVVELTKTLENMNAQNASPDIFGEKKGPDLGEGQGGKPNDNGNGSDSESETDSSDRGSGGSHSRSRSDGENGASSKSMDASDEDLDEDVDIMTSYDLKESSLNPVKSPGGRSLQYETNEKQEAEMASTTATIPMDTLTEQTFSQGTSKNLSIQAVNRAENVGNSIVGLETGYNQTFLGRSASDLTQTSQRSFKQTLLEKSYPLLEKSQGESLGNKKKHSGWDFQFCAGSSMLNIKWPSDTQNEDIRVINEKVSSIPQDGGGGSIQSLAMDSHFVKQAETVGKLRGGQQGPHHVHRESNHDEFLVMKSFEQKNSLEATLESRELSPTFVSSGFPRNLESPNLKISNILFKESTSSRATIMLSRPHHGRETNVETRSQNQLPEMSGGLGSNKSRATHCIDLEGRNDNNNATTNAFTPNPLEEAPARGEGSGFADENNRDQSWKEYFSDENSSYLKYEKDEAELKGAITSFSQYQEYVQEFREKYDSYMFLNKACKSYRDVYYALCKDLEDAKDDVDEYNSIMGKVMESYETYGVKHKRQKKIFVVLHREMESIQQRITEFVKAQNRR
ncbi:hypothetical protein RIF29_28055 [Crotalaria pallida]|uniref:OCEL domain-containing protein n=1 Tax=Crotalaria pallida TaxID=3830 RepID=A0AAN9ESK5_CROPI